MNVVAMEGDTGTESASNETRLDRGSRPWGNEVRGTMKGTTAKSSDYNMLPPSYNAVEFTICARTISEYGNRRRNAASQYYSQVFIVTPTVTEMVYNDITPSLPTDELPKNPIWDIFILMVYERDSVYEELTEVRRETF